MATLSFDTLYRSIRNGDFAPVTYLTGEEDTLKEELIAKALNGALDPTTLDFNHDVRSAGDLSPEAIIALVDTPPMMAERRFVVIKSLEQWRKNSKQWHALRKYAENPAPTTILFLTHRVGPKDKPDQSLRSTAKHAEIGRLEPGRVGDWIKANAKTKDVSLTDDAVEHLIKVVGSDLAMLGSEIEKLAASACDSEITVRDVEIMVGVNHGETVSDWIVSVIERRTVRAVEMLDVILPQSGVAGVRLVMTLGTALVGVRFARASLDEGRTKGQTQKALAAIMKSAKMYWLNFGAEADRWTRAADNWTAPQLDNALRSAYEADRALKSTVVAGERGTLMNMLFAMGVPEEER